MHRTSTCLLLVAAALVVAPRTARPDAEAAPKPLRTLLSEGAKAVSSATPDDCATQRERLLAIDPAQLSDDDWIDLHLTLAALHRRTVPVPDVPIPEPPTAHHTDFDRECLDAGRFPKGERRFAWLLRHRHGLELSPRDVMRLGREARRRVRAELAAFEREHGGGMTWREMAERERDDHPATHAEMIAACRRLADEALDAVESAGLLTVPDSARGLAVGAAPSTFPYPFAWYVPGSRDRNGVFRARYQVAPMPTDLTPEEQTLWLRDFDVHWLRVISGHECVPGHHLQFSRASGVKSRLRGLGYNSVYVEGWGFYSEGLLDRAGHLDAPLERLAMLRMRAWRAVRCYVDPALHLGRIRPSQAVQLLESEAAMSERAAKREVRKYLDRPTQPLGYWIGRRRIESMREHYLALHGTSLEREREFHDRLLDLGCIPLPLAEAVLLGERTRYDATRRR
jgi:uncharacterized protein (DUF885 family)